MIPNIVATVQGYAAHEESVFKGIADARSRLAVARKRYNDNVREFNTKIRAFPGSILAGSMGFAPRQYFEIDEASRQVPQVKF